MFFTAVINNWWEVPNQITSQKMRFYSDFQTRHDDSTWFPLFLLWNNINYFYDIEKVVVKVHVFRLWKRLLFYTFHFLIVSDLPTFINTLHSAAAGLSQQDQKCLAERQEMVKHWFVHSESMKVLFWK